MDRILFKMALPLVAVLAGATPTHAGFWLEHGNNRGDTGSLRGTAQTPTGTGSLNFIYGALGDTPNIDLYEIYIVDPTNFSATVTNGMNRDDNDQNHPVADSQLFLFDASGHGILANDDISNSNHLSSLPAGSVANLAPGLYYLAISGYDTDPMDSGGQYIFNNNFPGLQSPTGVGPLSQWDRNAAASSDSIGWYEITLTGAGYTNFVQAQGVPAPGGLVLLATGAIGLAAFRRWRPPAAA